MARDRISQLTRGSAPPNVGAQPWLCRRHAAGPRREVVMRTSTRTALPPFLLAAACALAALAPAARAGTLRDDAGFFSPDAQQQVRQALDRIQQKYGANVVIESYPAPPASVPAGGTEQERTQAYYQWML